MQLPDVALQVILYQGPICWIFTPSSTCSYPHSRFFIHVWQVDHDKKQANRYPDNATISYEGLFWPALVCVCVYVCQCSCRWVGLFGYSATVTILISSPYRTQAESDKGTITFWNLDRTMAAVRLWPVHPSIWVVAERPDSREDAIFITIFSCTLIFATRTLPLAKPFLAASTGWWNSCSQMLIKEMSVNTLTNEGLHRQLWAWTAFIPVCCFRIRKHHHEQGWCLTVSCPDGSATNFTWQLLF